MKNKILICVISVTLCFAFTLWAKDTSLKELSLKLIKSESDEKLVIIEKVASFNNTKAVKLLLTLSETEDLEIKEALSASLSKITNQNAISWMNTNASSFPNISVRTILTSALGKKGKTYSALLEGLNDDDLNVRLTALDALSKIPDTLDYLASSLSDLEYHQVRKETLNILSKYDTVDAIEIILSAINEDDLDIQWQVEDILTKKARHENIMDYYLRRLTDSDPKIRTLISKIIERKYKLLTPLRAEKVISIILKDLPNESKMTLIPKISSLSNIALIKGLPSDLKDNTINNLISILRIDKSPEIRIHVALCLSKLDCSDYHMTLQAIYNNETDWRVRSAINFILYQEDKNHNTAIDASLNWLIRNQEYDGSWDCDKLNPFSYQEFTLPDFYNEDELVDVSVTGLALLSFMGQGSTHKGGKYKDIIKKGLEYIISSQNPTGLINFPKSHKHDKNCTIQGFDHGKLPRRYNHNIATLTLVTLYAKTKDSFLKKYAQKSLSHSRDYREITYGWSFYLEPTDIGPSVYYIMALYLAKTKTDLEIYDSDIKDVHLYLDKLTQVDSGRIHHLEGPSYCFGGFDSMATGIFARVLLRKLNQEKDYIQTDKSAFDFLIKYLPNWQPYRGVKGNSTSLQNERTVIGIDDNIINQWYWYFMTLSLLNSDFLESTVLDSYKLKWSLKLKEVLLKYQRQGGDLDGSWDPIGAWGSVGGRIYSTTFGILTLQAINKFK